MVTERASGRTIKGTIHGYGWVSWADLRRALLDAGAEVAWADYDGFHIGHVPDQAPPYSHLWAWRRGGWSSRARIEGDRAVVGVLSFDGSTPDLGSVIHSDDVNCVVHETQSWPDGELRVGRQKPDVADQRFTIFQAAGEHPITFVVAAT